MNRKQAYQLVQETFPQTFDKARFRNFIINLLNRVDESKAFARSNRHIKDAFKSHVNRFERLGTYTTPDQDKLDVLVVHLTHESKLERARTAIRNFVADHLKLRDEKDAALVAFVSPSENLWRFSYVKMEYAAVRKDTGNVGVETRLTPARRFSYIVGEGESCHTAQTRFLDILQNTRTDPSLAEIETAFSVEAVTKEFFKLYTGLFEELHDALEKLTQKDATIREEFENKSISTVDFAKKLMGQIVFLYFIQKKGWLGVERGQEWGTGPRNFLGWLAKGEYCQYRNFFNDVLEPLFYDTLAHDRGHEAWDDRFGCRIPFLNGGLFEPLGGYDWEKTDILLPNSLFTNTEPVEEGITGTGIFNVFDRYNFTVNEAEPLEKEVAIDPEMLGKVFESLIEENRRKGMGAYYTPREIVHYMCQESLIQYLDNAINIQSESIVLGKPVQENLLGPTEPQQGTLKTAAYKERVPRGELETFVHLGEQISHYEAVETDYRVKMPKSIEQQARLIDEKLQAIRICDPAVGSGAFPIGMMMEIVRSRSTLTPYFNDIHERTPYHFKRHAIQNCLYGVDIDAGAIEIAKLRAWLSLVVDEEDVHQIKPLPNLDYKMVVGNSLFGVGRTLFNQELFQRLEDLKPRYFDEIDTAIKATLKTEIDDLIHQLTGGNQVFDFEIYFSEVYHEKSGFDIVIANPPYISHDQITEDKRVLKRQFKSFSAFADIYCVFIERALMITRRAGLLCFVTSNSYLKAEYGSNLRTFLSATSTIRMLHTLEASQIFSEAIVNVAILLAEKIGSQGLGTALVSIRPWNTGSFREHVFSSSYQIPITHFNSSQWSLARQEVLAIKLKIESSGQTIKQLGGKIRLGIATGFNKAFVIEQSTKEKLVAAQSSVADIIVPIIRGKDIQKYGALNPKVFLIAAKNGVSIRRDYGAIYNYFETFGEDFRQRGAQGQNWWNLRACAFYDDFDQGKIVWIELTDQARFTHCSAGIWCLNSSYFMLAPRGYSENYLLSILNSRVIQFYLKLIAQTSGMGVPRWINLYVEQFPIPDAPSAKRKQLEAIVGTILAIKKDNLDATTTELEREIDRLVYALYGLTEEEIRIVEGG